MHPITPNMVVLFHGSGTKIVPQRVTQLFSLNSFYHLLEWLVLERIHRQVDVSFHVIDGKQQSDPGVKPIPSAAATIGTKRWPHEAPHRPISPAVRLPSSVARFFLPHTRQSPCRPPYECPQKRVRSWCVNHIVSLSIATQCSLFSRILKNDKTFWIILSERIMNKALAT